MQAGERMALRLESVERDLLRLLVESVGDYAIFALDRNGNVATWNLGAERIKGWSREEILGRHFSIFYTDEDVASRKPWRELEEAAALGRVEDEGWRVRRDGSTFRANVVITALRDPDEGLFGFAKVTRDLTDQLVAEEGRRQMSLLEQRERLAWRLREGSIGDLFGIGLRLHPLLDASDAETRRRVNDAVAGIDRVIERLREDLFRS